MSCSILSCSINFAARLFPTPSNKSQCSFGSKSIFYQKSKGFEDSNESSSIIISASLRSCIPSINVSSCKDNLIWVSRSNYFKNNIIWICVWDELVFQDKPHFYNLATVLHSLEHLRVLDCDCCTWNFGIITVVFHITSMHWWNTLRSNGSYQYCFRSVFDCSWSTINSIGHRFTIVNPFIVVADNLTSYFSFVSF